MAGKRKDNTKKHTKAPKSLRIAENGITTGKQFAAMMSALMSDIISARVNPSVANATCNAGGKLLKVVEMQFKYGIPDKQGQHRLTLVAVEPPTKTGE